MTTEATAAPAVGPDRRVERRGLTAQVLRNPLGATAAAVLLLIVLSAALAPVLAAHGPNDSQLADVLAPMSADHPLGGDSAGRDLLSRLLHGGQLSLLGGAFALAVALSFGVPSGLVAGYYGGWADGISGWLTNLVMALPGVMVLLAVRAAVGPSIWISMGVFGVLLAPSFHRLVRSSVVAVRNELYVDAARVAGLSDRRIIARHVLRAVRAPIVIQAAMIMSLAIAIQAGLEFLGLGDLTRPSWGMILNEGFQNIYRAPGILLWSGLLLSLTSASLVLLGNAVRDALQGSGESAATPRPATPAPVAEVDTPDPTPAPESALLAIDRLTVGYGDGNDGWRPVVDGVSLHVSAGEVLGLVGESGSGKTQTSLAVLGLLPEGGAVLSGAIRFDGVDLATAPRKARESLLGTRIAYVPQEPMSNLDPSFTVGDQLVEPLRTRLGMSRTGARERALELLARVGIPEPRRAFASYPHQISGGMAQRVLIAGAVSCEPDLLIADEPTTALDVTVQAEILDLLRDLQREHRMALVLVTHNLGVVADVCDRVAVMRDGRLVEVAGVREIFADPRHPYTRQLLGATLEGAPPRAAYQAPATTEVTA
ncbi:ATP-binding cassette domain-containing protein [Streptomyces sp. NPDC127098]|uniref:ATP-binding cassette domain-containing protein n=1 Tax=Streptomyces sp. NPDC127098 TaxID=3347137 RepID=UPI0036472584